MKVAPWPSTETERLAALRQLELLDTPPEEAFDALTRLASNVLGVPIAVMSLIDENRQWFKSRAGTDAIETPRDIAFCAHAILEDSVFVVEDAIRDERFADNPLVTDGPRVRAYAGVPLRTSEGHAIGTLCAMDRKPHVFDVRQIAILEDLATLATREIRHREATARARRVASANAQAASSSESLYRASFDRAAIGIAVVGLDGRWLRMNPALCAILDRSEAELSRLTFQDITHAEDLDTDLGLLSQLLTGEHDHYALQKRYIRPQGQVVWANLTVTLVRGDDGQPRHFVSVVEDISERRATEQALEQLRFELEQRVDERTADLQLANEFLAESVRQRQRSEDALVEREADLRAVLTNAQEAYISIDSKGLVVEWNPHAEATFGWSRDEVIGRPLDELIMPPTYRTPTRDGMAGSLRKAIGRALNRRLELPAMRRDGTVFPCEVSIMALASRTRGQFYAGFMRDISERKEAERRIAEANNRLEDLYQNSPCGYYSLDEHGVFVRANDVSLQLLGCTREELLHRRSQSEFLSAEGARRFAAEYPRFMAEGHFGPEEFDLNGADGQMRRISVRATALRDEQGHFLHSRTVIFDVTELHQARLALEAVNRQQHLMLDNELFAIIKMKNREITWANRAFERLVGCEGQSQVGRPIRDFYADAAVYEREGAIGYRSLAEGGSHRTQVEFMRPGGERFWTDISGALLSAETGESMWMMLDITAMKQHQRKVEALAYHDALTSLPNRMLLIDRLQQALAWARRAGHHVAVCFGDLDGFKAVNDEHGHDAGDQLLREVARRLAAAVRPHDTVARLGGDEFVLVLTQLASPQDSDLVMRRAIDAVAEPFVLSGGAATQVTVSFGVAHSPADGTEAASLLAHADAAMYEKKRRHKAARAQATNGERDPRVTP